VYNILRDVAQFGVKAMSENEKRQRRPAIGYIRQSSTTNVGADKDGEVRQRKAIQAYANRAGYRIVEWVPDLDVSGADHIDARPGFAHILETIAGNGVRTIIVETANRFARDLMVQEAGCARLKAAGINLIAADKPDGFADDTPTAKLVRQILGAVAEFDKAMLVAKLAGARQRKKRLTGKCGGRKSVHQAYPEAVAMVHQLRADQPRLSYRKISAALRDAGHVTRRGTEHSPTAIRHMLEGPVTPSGKPHSASAVQSMPG
jgi:DNA invertase Pin-like site-specific DNA recombinase